jgi:hypothetical protein
MVLRRAVPALVLAAALAVPLATSVAARADDGPRPGQVTISVKEYLALLDAGEKAERERAQRAADRVEPLAEVVAQKTRITIDAAETAFEAAVAADFEVLVQGAPKSVVVLPVSFVPGRSEIRALGTGSFVDRSGNRVATSAALSASQGGLFLTATQAGRYAVTIEGRSKLASADGVSRFAFAPVAAPVAVAEVDLPAELEWGAPGAVVVEEKVEAGRRKVRLTARRGESPALEVHRKVEGGDAEKLLAQCVILTLVQLGPEGAVRHDVVLYEVSRGKLASFAVDLPPGLNVEAVGTDEGSVVPVGDAQSLTVQRRNQLQKTGFLVLTSRPGGEAEGASLAAVPLPQILPRVEVRARYLAVASTVAAQARPQPETDWARVDLEDLPADFRDALSALDPTAAWRFSPTSAPPSAGAGADSRLAVERLRTAAVLPAVVRRRDTTTIVTVDGTVLHRDRLTLHPVNGVAAALEMVLPPTATLWSATVDNVPVRPLEHNGRLTVPLGFNEGKGPVVEIVSVIAKAIPRGRSQLALELPRVEAPVKDHRWRLFLPSGARYRFQGGELRPVPAAQVTAGKIAFRGGTPIAAPEEQPLDTRKVSTGATVAQTELEKIPTARDPWSILATKPGALKDRVNVGGNESGQQSGYYDAEAWKEMRDEVASLRNGLVGGVRPLPVTMPESGKVLYLAALLPPGRVSVQLDVKAKR